jgi:hypothetical protein
VEISQGVGGRNGQMLSCHSSAGFLLSFCSPTAEDVNGLEKSKVGAGNVVESAAAARKSKAKRSRRRERPNRLVGGNAGPADGSSSCAFNRDMRATATTARVATAKCDRLIAEDDSHAPAKT